MKRAVRKIHRWLGLLMLVQLLAWMVSGFYFTLHPIVEIRGEHLTRAADPFTPGDLDSTVPLRAIGAALSAEFGAEWRLETVGLFSSGDRLCWRAEGIAGDQPFRRLVALDGSAVLPDLAAAEAARRAVGWLRSPAEPVSISWIDAGGGGHDLRGRSGPAWKVTFEQPDAIDLYLDPWTGELLARRTDRWRLFDFMWMLHIMDYDAREDFHHPLLQAAAVAGLLVAISGLAFWLLTRRRSSVGVRSTRGGR